MTTYSNPRTNAMTREKSPHAAAAGQIRAKLKKLGIAAQVKSDSFAGGNSVDVTVFDATPNILQQVNKIANPHQYGHFDGMTDCYEYSNKRSDLAQVKFVMVHNRISPETYQKVYDFIRTTFAGGEALPEKYEDAHSVQFHGGWADQLVHRQLSQADSLYWKHQTGNRN